MVTELKSPPASSPSAPLSARRAPVPGKKSGWAPLLIILALVLLLAIGIWRHVRQSHAQREFAEQTGKTVVEVVTVKRDGKPHDLIVPGNITAMQETTIYARANGYVARWLVDIGDEVKTGQLLAELETPELDQQLASAQGSVRQSEANFELSRTTAQRWQELAKKQVVAQQDNDERQGNYFASAAGLSASKANAAQLEQLQGFKKVIAPFDGKITARKVDVGALVSQGSGTAGTALFTLAQTDPLRILADVPQDDAPLIEVGAEAKILVRERANRDFTGKITRTSGALDPASRTLRVEVQIPNQDGALFAGMYGQLKFTLHDKESPIMIPADVFVFRPSGTQVAVLDSGNKVHWQRIEVGRDFGTQMEVLKGLEENTQVIVNPSDDLTEGLQVEAKPREAQQPAAPPASK